MLAVDVIGPSPSASAAFEAFLQIDGIPGDSTDLKHKGTIEIESFSWGATQTGAVRPGRAFADDLDFVSPVGSASPALFKAAATGEHIKKAVLFVRKAGGDQQDYLKVTLQDVLVSSLHARSLNDGNPLEELSFRFSRIDEEYRPTLEDGSLGEPLTSAWSVSPAAFAGGTEPTLLDQQPATPENKVDAFLQIDGIPGESADAKHKDWIEIDSFSWGLSNSGSSRGLSAGRLSMQDFRFVAPAGPASPLLMGGVANGKRFASATLAVRRFGSDGELDYLSYKLEDILISSYQTRSVDASVPMDEVSLNFTKLTESHVLPDSGAGAVPAAVSATWSNFDRAAAYQPGRSILDQTTAPQGKVGSFLQVAGVDGGSGGAKAPGAMEIESFSWGVSRPVVSRRSGGGVGKVSLQDFHFVASVDKSSPKLMLASATGQHISKAQLLVSAGSGDSEFGDLVYNLSDLLVSSYQMRSVDESLPLNEFALRFNQMQETYVPSASGLEVSSEVTSKWTVPPSVTRDPGPTQLGNTTRAPRAVDVFLEIGGILGESADHKHKGTIEIDSFSWGVSQAGTFSGGSSGRLALEPFHFVTETSEASPPLLSRVLSGQHLPSATLYVRRSGTVDDYLKIELSDLLVSSYQTQSLNQKLPLEEFTLNFARLAQTYELPVGPGVPPSSVQASLDASSRRNAFVTPDRLLDITTAPAETAHLYIKYDGIDGDAALGGAIEVSSFSWGVSNAGSSSGGGRRGVGKVSMQDFHFVSTSNTSSPDLLRAVATGKHISKVDFVVARAPGSTADNFLKYELKDVLVSSFQTSGHSGTAPLEEVTLNFTNLEQQYVPESPDTAGTSVSPVITQWSHGNPSAAYSRGRSILSETTAPPLDGQMFLAVDGIAGESQDKQQKGSIDIESFSWGLSQAISRRTTGGGGSGKVSMQDFHFVADLSKASPQLLDAVAKGKHFPSAVLTLRANADRPLNFLKYEIKNVLVSSYRAQGLGGAAPTDRFSLGFDANSLNYLVSNSSGAAAYSAGVDAYFGTN
jgi:type VI secretion system Hcp family effector